MFRQSMLSKFNKRNMSNNKPFNNKSDKKKKNNPVEFFNLPVPVLKKPSLSVPPRLSKEELNKSKFYKKNLGKIASQQSYTQASSANIKKILKIKEYFSQLLDKKVKEVYKTIINSSKPKLYINITTKEPSQKQIIVLISSNNISVFMKVSDEYVSNMNYTLKVVKSDNFINFICLDH